MKEQFFKETQMRDRQAKETLEALELLEYIDPQTSLASDGAQAVKKTVRSSFSFHPYLIYKTNAVKRIKPVNEEELEDGSDFGGFFPVSLGVQVAYLIQGKHIKVWNVQSGE